MKNVKFRSSIRARTEAGLYLGAYAPSGYRKVLCAVVVSDCSATILPAVALLGLSLALNIPDKIPIEITLPS